MKTDKYRIHLFIKSELKVSTLAIIRKLKPETTNRMCETQNEYLGKYCWKVHKLGSDGYFTYSINNACKETVQNYIPNQN